MGRKAKEIPAGVLEAMSRPQRVFVTPLQNAENLFTSYATDFRAEADAMAKAIEEGQSLYTEEAAGLWMDARAHIAGMVHAFARFRVQMPKDIRREVDAAQAELDRLLGRGRGHTLLLRA